MRYAEGGNFDETREVLLARSGLLDRGWRQGLRGIRHERNDRAAERSEFQVTSCN